MTHKEFHPSPKTLAAFDTLARLGVSTIDVLRAFGHEVMQTPDGEICAIVDAPAVEYADGRKINQDGTYRSEIVKRVKRRDAT